MSRRQGVVGHVSRARDERLLVAARVVEPLAGGVPEQRRRSPRQTLRFQQPRRIAVRAVERQQAVNQRGVVVQKALPAVVGFAVRSPQPSVFHHALQQEGGVGARRVQIVAPAERRRHFGKRRHRQAVPRRYRLRVRHRRDALRPRRQQLGLGARYQRRQLARRHRVARRHLVRRARDVQNRHALEVALSRDAEVVADDRRVLFAQDVRYLFGTPHEELALHALAVGVLGGAEAAVGGRHLAQQIVAHALRRLAVFGARRQLPRARVERGEQGVVVEHLLEVGDEPEGVGGVSVKAAAYLVVNPARRHLV